MIRFEIVKVSDEERIAFERQFAKNIRNSIAAEAADRRYGILSVIGWIVAGFVVLRLVGCGLGI